MQVKVKAYDEDGDVVEIEVAGRYEVCDRCDGHGVTCRLGAMTASEYREICYDDPDFPDDYKAGVYDQPCPVCKGQRVVAEPDYDAIPQDIQERIDTYNRHEAESAANDRYWARVESGGRDY